MLTCAQSFSYSWSLNLLLFTFHSPLPVLLGVITSAHQLITLGLFPFTVWLVSSCPGESGLLHPPNWPVQCRLPDWLTLLHLPDQHWLLLLIVLPGFFHLTVQPGLPHLLVRTILFLPGRTGLLLLLTQAGLLLVDCPGPVHQLSSAQHVCSFVLLWVSCLLDLVQVCFMLRQV